MRSYIALALTAFMTLSGAACARQTPLEKAAALLGAEQVKTIKSSPPARTSRRAELHGGRRVAEVSPSRTTRPSINYDTNSARVELLREMGAVMPTRRRRALLRRTAPGPGRQRRLRLERAGARRRAGGARARRAAGTHAGASGRRRRAS